MIGKLATDGVAIMSPEDDVIDTFQDYDHSSMRFFGWLKVSAFNQLLRSYVISFYLREEHLLLTKKCCGGLQIKIKILDLGYGVVIILTCLEVFENTDIRETLQ